MHITTQYRRLSSAEREEVSRGLAQGTGLSAIARRLGRAPCTVSREVEHNSGKSGYRAFSAGRRHALSRVSRKHGKSRLTSDDRLRRYVIEKLRKRGSPRGSLKTTFIKALRQERAYRRKRKRGNHEETRGKIAEMLSIEERPQEVADRTMPATGRATSFLASISAPHSAPWWNAPHGIPFLFRSQRKTRHQCEKPMR